MGFNNGYDSGYSDCEAENRKRWEREAVERYKAENPPSGGGSSASLRTAGLFTLVPRDERLGDETIVGVMSVSGLTTVACTSTHTTENDVVSVAYEATPPEGGFVPGDVMVINMVGEALDLSSTITITVAGASLSSSVVNNLHTDGQMVLLQFNGTAWQVKKTGSGFL